LHSYLEELRFIKEFWQTLMSQEYCRVAFLDISLAQTHHEYRWEASLCRDRRHPSRFGGAPGLRHSSRLAAHGTGFLSQ
jgi:hypothetical protein